MVRWLVVACLFLIQAMFIGWIGWNACPNKTETGHMGAAVYFWHTLRFDVFCVNPPLTRVVSGLPVILCDPKYDWNAYSPRPQDRSEWPMGTAFVASNSPERIRWCFALGRWSLIPLLLLGGYFGYRWSREIYGEAAGLVFLVLWCFSPMLLAWGATVCPDVVAAALGVVAVYTFRRWLYKPDWMRATLAGFCLGLLPLTKLTWIIAFGLWLAIWCVWAIPIYWSKIDKRLLPWPPLRQLAVILLIGLYTLNLGYLFDGTFRPLGKYVFISQLLRGPDASKGPNASPQQNRFAGTWLGAIPVPLPADFVQGIDTQRLDFERGMPSYLRGQWDDHGWWYYYLYALAVKEPLGIWCLVLLAIGATVVGRGFSASWRDEMLLLGPCLAIFVFVSSQNGFSAHSRYIIPALPFLFLWTSKIGRVFQMHPLTWPQRAAATAVLLMMVWMIGASLAVFPHSLSYFNELAILLPTDADVSYPKPMNQNDSDRGIRSFISDAISAGPRNGPRHLLESNIDWGQDLYRLEDWCRSHPEAKPIKVAYFGSYPLDRSSIKSAGFPAVGMDGQIGHVANTSDIGPLPGWYAVSVSTIYGRTQQHRYFLHFKPVAMAGYSIYIYHITLKEANRVCRELGRPELRMTGDQRGANHARQPHN